MIVTDARLPDHLIILTNQAFMDLTGYESEEIIVQNCRFLQGQDTLKVDIAKLRGCIVPCG